MATKKVKTPVKAVKAPVKKEAVKKETKTATPKWEPSIGELCWWVKKDSKFMGEITSFNPLTVINHTVYDNVHRTHEINVEMKDYKLTPMTKEEIYENLY